MWLLTWPTTIDWAFVGDMIAAATLVVTIIALIVTIYALIKQLRVTYSVENVWRFKDQWEGDEMNRCRNTVAKDIKEDRPRVTRDYITILMFFDAIGYLVQRRALQAEAVWAILGDDILSWYDTLTSPKLEKFPRLAPSEAPLFDSLAQRMRKIDRRHPRLKPPEHDDLW